MKLVGFQRKPIPSGADWSQVQAAMNVPLPHVLGFVPQQEQRALAIDALLEDVDAALAASVSTVPPPAPAAAAAAAAGTGAGLRVGGGHGGALAMKASAAAGRARALLGSPSEGAHPDAPTSTPTSTPTPT